MRINVYSQELTSEVQVEEKESNTGLIYTGIRLMLHSSKMLHHPGTIVNKPCPRCNGKGEHFEANVACAEECADCGGTGTQVFEQDDDRSGITFWLPKSEDRREALAKTFEEIARLVRDAKPETGLD